MWHPFLNITESINTKTRKLKGNYSVEHKISACKNYVIVKIDYKRRFIIDFQQKLFNLTAGLLLIGGNFLRAKFH